MTQACAHHRQVCILSRWTVLGGSLAAPPVPDGRYFASASMGFTTIALSVQSPLRSMDALATISTNCH